MDILCLYTFTLRTFNILYCVANVYFNESLLFSILHYVNIILRIA